VEPKLYDYGDLDESGGTERFEDPARQANGVVYVLVCVVCAVVLFLWGWCAVVMSVDASSQDGAGNRPQSAAR
jgi:hypothetical protein